MGLQLYHASNVSEYMRRDIPDNVRMGLSLVGGSSFKRMVHVGNRAIVEFRQFAFQNHGVDFAGHIRDYRHAAGMVDEPQYQFHVRSRSFEHIPVFFVPMPGSDIQLGQLRSAVADGGVRTVFLLLH